MLILIVAIIALLIAASIVCGVLSCKIKQLSFRVKELESKASEAETLSERGVRNFANSLMEHYREDTTVQIKRMDEMLKIFDEKRSALDDQMNMTRTVADTLVDAFKHRLDEAEKKCQEK